MKKLLALALLAPSLAFAEVSTTSMSLEPATELISIEAGALSNKSDDGSRFQGIGLRYAHTVGTELLSSNDSLSLEGGAFLYRVVNYVLLGDDYSVVPVSVVAQYGRTYRGMFHPYLYGGVMKNFSFAGGLSDKSTSQALSNFLPAAGIGLSVSFKGVIARADIGTDLIGAGLAYGF